MSPAQRPTCKYPPESKLCGSEPPSVWHSSSKNMSQEAQEVTEEMPPCRCGPGGRPERGERGSGSVHGGCWGFSLFWMFGVFFSWRTLLY